MDMQELERIHGEYFTGLLSAGLDWISRYSLHLPSHPTEHLIQAVSAAMLHSLQRADIHAFTRILSYIENIYSFNYSYMKIWLREHNTFAREDVIRCLRCLAWLVGEDIISPQSPLINAITGLEEQYNLSDAFVQESITYSKWKSGTLKTEINEKESELNSVNMQMTSTNETVPLKVAVPSEDIADTPSSHTARSDDFSGENEMLLDKEGNEIDQETLLHLALERGHVDAEQSVKSTSELLNVFNEDGNTPLHIAVASGQVDKVKMLTAAGASVMQPNLNGILPLHLASNPEIIKHLVARGTPVDTKTPAAGETALHLAAFNGDVEAVEALMRLGADPDATNASGNTPLLLAMQSYSLDVVDLLSPSLPYY